MHPAKLGSKPVEAPTVPSRSYIRIAFSLLIGTCLAGNALGTFLLFEFDTGSWTVQAVCYAIGAGLILGQVTLLAIWGALSAEPIIIRMPRALALSVLVLYSWLLGAKTSASQVPLDVSIVISVMGMLLFLILTTPLWIARRCSRCSVVAGPGADARREQFTLRHVLVWTAVVAGMTALGKIFVQSSGVSNMPPTRDLLQIMAIVAVISLFVAMLGLPLTWGVLAKRPSFTAWSLILMILLFGPPMIPEVCYIFFRSQPSLDDRLVAIVAWYGFAIATLTTTSAGLFLARALGFRLLPIRVHTKAPNSADANWRA